MQGTLAFRAQLVIKLSSSAEMVAEELAAAKERNRQWQQKVDHAQPRKQDIEKAEGEIEDRPEPKIVIPALFPVHTADLSFTSIMQAGQVFAHLPQPTHFSEFTWA